MFTKVNLNIRVRLVCEKCLYYVTCCVYKAINYYSHCNATNQEKYINNLKHIALDIVHCLGSTVCGCGEGGKYAGVFLISAQRETHLDIRGLALITRTLTTTISVSAPQFKIDIS